MSVLQLDGSRRMDIHVRRGATINKTVAVVHEDSGEDYSFAGKTGSLEVYSTESDAIPNLLFNAANGLVLEDGSFTLSKPSTIWTPKMRRRKYIYFFWLVDEDEVKELWLNGYFVIEEGVTPLQSINNIINVAAGGDNLTLRISTSGGTPAVDYYGPYATRAAAQAAVPVEERQYTTVFVSDYDNDEVGEFWWLNGTDIVYLVPKEPTRLQTNITDQNAKLYLKVVAPIGGGQNFSYQVGVDVLDAGEGGLGAAPGGGMILGNGIPLPDGGGNPYAGQEQLPFLSRGMIAFRTTSASPQNEEGFFIAWVDNDGQLRTQFHKVGDVSSSAGRILTVRDEVDQFGFRMKDNNGVERVVFIDNEDGLLYAVPV